MSDSVISVAWQSLPTNGLEFYSFSYAAGNLYGVEYDTKNIFQLRSQNWVQIANPVDQLVGNNKALYALMPGGNSIAEYSNGVWVNPIGPAAKTLVASGDLLYAVFKEDNMLYRYNGTPNSWTTTQGWGTMFVANHLFVFAANESNVWMYNGSTWIQIGSDMPDVKLAASDKGVFAIYDRRVWRWTGIAKDWQLITGEAEEIYLIVAGGDWLVRRRHGTMLGYFEDTNEWKPIANQGQRLLITKHNIVYGTPESGPGYLDLNPIFSENPF